MNRTTKARPSPKRPDPRGNGHPAAGAFRLEPAGRKVAVPQLLVALFLVAVSALVAVVLFSRAAAREPILALAESVERGQAISSSDLRVVYVATDDPIASLSGDAAPGLVGLTAVADLEEGTILTSAHLVARTLLDSGEGVVGLALAPGEYPTPFLAPGDMVDVVITDDTSVSVGETSVDLVFSSAEVFDVADLGSQGQRFISLRMPSGSAAEVARAASSGQVRLVLVAGEDG